MDSLVNRIYLFVQEVANDVKALIANKAEKSVVDAFTATINNKADKSTTASGYGIVDVYTKTETDEEIDLRIQAVVGTAPANLDTLQEIAAEMGNDKNAVAALTAVVASKASQTDLNTTNSNLSALSSVVSGKEPTIAAGTATQYWKGNKTWGNFATDVLSTVLTGLSTAVSTAVAAGDTILVAIGKLQAQINGQATSISELSDISEDRFSFVKSGVDSFGVFTDVRHYRQNGTLYKKSVLSGGTAPYYTVRTLTFYQADGVTIRATQTYTLAYTNNVLTSETIN